MSSREIERWFTNGETSHMKLRILILAIIYLLIPVQYVYSATSASDGIDILRFKELQILAVDVDVMLPLGWAQDDKELIKSTASGALKTLGNLKSDLLDFDLPNEIEAVRAYHLERIDRMAALYTNLDKKSSDEIEAGYANIQIFSDARYKDVDAIYGKYLLKEELPSNFDQIQEETRFASSKEDIEAYTAATQFIKNREFNKAVDLLEELEPKYKDSPFTASILLRLSDCLISAERDVLHGPLAVDDVENGEAILQKIVTGKTYSPVLAEAFVKWRSVVQTNNHGMSNMSAIPNNEYNERRWELVQAIKEYLKTSQNDVWARAQIRSLLAWPNINRGGPYGNDNLIYYGRMYLDISGEEEKPA